MVKIEKRYKVLGSKVQNSLVISKELEERFHNYAKAVRNYCTKIKWNFINNEYIKQVIRSIGPVSANYTEASDDLGKSR